MGVCETSNVSVFTFINANDLIFCTRSYSSCVYRMMRFKGSNGKVCKMMTSHFRTVYFKGTVSATDLFLLTSGDAHDLLHCLK